MDAQLLDIIKHQLFWGFISFICFLLVFVKLLAEKIENSLKNRDIFFNNMNNKINLNLIKKSEMEEKICYLIEDREKQIEDYIKNKSLLDEEVWNKILDKERENILFLNIEFDEVLYKKENLSDIFLNKLEQ